MVEDFTIGSHNDNLAPIPEFVEIGYSFSSQPKISSEKPGSNTAVQQVADEDQAAPPESRKNSLLAKLEHYGGLGAQFAFMAMAHRPLMRGPSFLRGIFGRGALEQSPSLEPSRWQNFRIGMIMLGRGIGGTGNNIPLRRIFRDHLGPALVPGPKSWQRWRRTPLAPSDDQQLAFSFEFPAMPKRQPRRPADRRRERADDRQKASEAAPPDTNTPPDPSDPPSGGGPGAASADAPPPVGGGPGGSTSDAPRDPPHPFSGGRPGSANDDTSPPQPSGRGDRTPEQPEPHSRPGGEQPTEGQPPPADRTDEPAPSPAPAEPTPEQVAQTAENGTGQHEPLSDTEVEQARRELNQRFQGSPTIEGQNGAAAAPTADAPTGPAEPRRMNYKRGGQAMRAIRPAQGQEDHPYVQQQDGTWVGAYETADGLKVEVRMYPKGMEMPNKTILDHEWRIFSRSDNRTFVFEHKSGRNYDPRMTLPDGTPLPGATPLPDDPSSGN